MTSEVINTIGLACNILGVILIFFFGLPQPSHDEGVFFGLEDGTVLADGTSVKDINAKIKKRKAIYRGLASLALCLMILGFVFQILSIWVYR